MQTITPTITIKRKGETFVGKQIAAFVRINRGLVVLELADGSQLQFSVNGDALEVGAFMEPQH